MKKTILIMGLPGSGKTTLSKELVKKLVEAEYPVTYINADATRTEYYDWDFSYTGRLRQAIRMKNLAARASDGYVIIDMVAPLPEFRKVINPQITIWVDTISESRFKDTNKMFIEPDQYHFRVTEQDSEAWSSKIFEELHTNIVELITTIL